MLTLATSGDTFGTWAHRALFEGEWLAEVASGARPYPFSEDPPGLVYYLRAICTGVPVGERSDNLYVTLVNRNHQVVTVPWFDEHGSTFDFVRINDYVIVTFNITPLWKPLTYNLTSSVPQVGNRDLMIYSTDATPCNIERIEPK